MSQELLAAVVGGAISGAVPVVIGMLAIAVAWGATRQRLRSLVDDVHGIRQELARADLGGLRADVRNQGTWLKGHEGRLHELELETRRPGHG